MSRLSNATFVAVLSAVGVLVAASPFTAFAATTPSLGAASTYGVLSSTFSNTNPTTVNGDVGFTTGSTLPLGARTNYGSGAPYSQAGTDQGAALSSLASQPCDFPLAAGQDLSLLSQPLKPGVYCSTGAISIGTGGITLNGAGTYLFRATGALNTVAGSVVTLSSGASACNVFWTPTATTLGANSTFAGTDIDNSGITVGSTVTWVGRALDFATTVTTNTDTISVPSCSTPPVTPSAPIVYPIIGGSGGSGQSIYPTAPTTYYLPASSTQATTSPIITTTTVTTRTTPGFPNTGFAPEGKSALWSYVMIAGLLGLAVASFTVISRKRTS
jgi:hypothetical protein